MIKIAIFVMLAWRAVTLLPQLALKIAGIAVFTFGFSVRIRSQAPGSARRPGDHRAQASSLYLLAYYIGSSVAGSCGGFFWTHFHWIGIISFISVLLLLSYPVLFLAEFRKRDIAACM